MDGTCQSPQTDGPVQVVAPYPHVVEIRPGMTRAEYLWLRWRKPAYRLDYLGWPIETVRRRPIQSRVRIWCQNIRKFLR